MVDFFSWVVAFFTNIGTFFSSVLNGLILLFRIVTSVISFPASVIGFLPSFLFSSIIICVSIWVVKLVTGR